MSTTWTAAIFAGLLIAFGMVSSIDYTDEQREQQVYCDNVRAGYWPDYNNNAEEVCR